MSFISDKQEFIAIVKAETPSMPASVARQIITHADVIQRTAYEDSSVEDLYNRNERLRARCPICQKEGPADRTYDLSRPKTCPEHHAEREIRELCKPYDVQPSFDGDPRGACVKLKVPSGRNNSFGGGGWICVPTREY